MVVEQRIPGTRLKVWLCTKERWLLFQEKPRPTLNCMGCQDVYVKPLISPCGHTLCEKCVHRLCAKNGRCYQCNEPAMPTDFATDTSLQSMVDALPVYCKFGLEEFDHPEGYVGLAIAPDGGEEGGAGHGGGCRAVVPWGQKEAHERTCPYRRVRCEQVDSQDKTVRCEFEGVKRAMPSHLVHCEFVADPCPFEETGCSFRTSRFRMPKHVATCVYRPFECPNACGMVVSPGEATRAHLEWCPAQALECGMEDAEDPAQRCPVVVERREMGNHRAHHCMYGRRRKCVHCQAVVSLAGEKAHQGTCMEARVGCPNHCGNFPRRRQLDEHLEKMCPMVEAACSFAPFGCRERSARGHMGVHMQQAHLRHLDFVGSSLAVARDGVGEVVEWKRDTQGKIEEQMRELRAGFEREVEQWRGEQQETVRRQKDESARLSKVAAEEMEAIRAMLEDQARTYSTKILSMHGELRALQGDMRELKEEVSGRLGRVEARVGALETGHGAAIDELGRGVKCAASDDAMHRALGDYREEMGRHVTDEVGRLREDVEAMGLSAHAKITDLWERVQGLARRFT